ncbi:MAG: hypothetical protein A2Z25_07450 [Planctomycetes bacterium RBG_16_55_9]|nr:MAG: hypothetical protein A2Z25_07450 [Planctomycetes bacterium RBG_16_55_9]
MKRTSGFSKRFFLFFYVGTWSVLLAAAGTWLTVYLVGTLGDSLTAKQTQPAEMEVFDSVLALTDKKVVRYLGEWEFLEPKLPGHFHHIGRWYQSDKWNFCVKCHGQTPHSRTPQLRAFLNMHNLFISCQVCHVREQADVELTRFGWADMTYGKVCSSPEMADHPWGEYDAKIVPLNGPEDQPRPITLDDEEVFAEEFLKRRDTLGDQQKVIANKFIHRRCVETPVRCTDCHNSEDTFLPYTALGYSSERADFLVSAEVVDLIRRYETFHIPNLLRPQGQEVQRADERETISNNE